MGAGVTQEVIAAAWAWPASFAAVIGMSALLLVLVYLLLRRSFGYDAIDSDAGRLSGPSQLCLKLAAGVEKAIWSVSVSF